MIVRSLIVTGALALEIAIGLTALRTPRERRDPDPGSRATDSEKVTAPSAERGRYLVHHVAMCIQCHTPRRDDTTLDRRQLLAGARIPVKSPYPRETWAFRAPKIAGLRGGWEEDDMVRFLRTGKSPTGHEPRAPMPPFRMSEEDARSVALYTSTLSAMP